MKCIVEVDENNWVVLLTDPDGCDWSPWSVRAKSPLEAIEAARKQWREMYDYDEDYKEGVDDPPELTPDSVIEVWKVYQGSWINMRVWECEWDGWETPECAADTFKNE